MYKQDERAEHAASEVELRSQMKRKERHSREGSCDSSCLLVEQSQVSLVRSWSLALTSGKQQVRTQELVTPEIQALENKLVSRRRPGSILGHKQYPKCMLHRVSVHADSFRRFGA